MRCRPSDAAVQQLLLPNILVPVDLSLHGSLRKPTDTGPRSTEVSTAASVRHSGHAERKTPAVMGCFSHPAAGAVVEREQRLSSSKAEISAGRSGPALMLCIRHVCAVAVRAVLSLPLFEQSFNAVKAHLLLAGGPAGARRGSVMRLEPPAVLVGDGGEDWLELTPAALRLWEQVRAEPDPLLPAARLSRRRTA